MPRRDERVTVTLPADMVADIDRRERNRSRFIREAVQRELERRRRDALRSSLAAPHDESAELEGLGLEEWVGAVEDHGDPLLETDAGVDVRWTPGSGWTVTEEA